MWSTFNSCTIYIGNSNSISYAQFLSGTHYLTHGRYCNCILLFTWVSFIGTTICFVINHLCPNEDPCYGRDSVSQSEDNTKGHTISRGKPTYIHAGVIFFVLWTVRPGVCETFFFFFLAHPGRHGSILLKIIITSLTQAMCIIFWNYYVSSKYSVNEILHLLSAGLPWSQPTSSTDVTEPQRLSKQEWNRPITKQNEWQQTFHWWYTQLADVGYLNSIADYLCPSYLCPYRNIGLTWLPDWIYAEFSFSKEQRGYLKQIADTDYSRFCLQSVSWW